ncbi:MAG: hypothetical protein VX764_00205 [Planctomycetota bacterium]|nr:hypothetical protein [Planctomycetota bacterium]
MGDYADYARDNFDSNGPAANVDKDQKKEVVFGVEEANALNAVNYPVKDSTDVPATTPVNTASDSSNAAVAQGRGLDVGTANLVSSFQDSTGNVNLKIQRNAFIDIDCDDYTRNMLTRLGVQYVVVNNRMVVVGDPAFELANIFNRNTRRPMKDGMISPDETDALPIERMLLETLLGQPKQQGENCYFSVPAEPIDAEMNVVYHQGVFGGLLKGLGYDPKPLVEGHAVVFSELAEDDFTGIGISCGGGMFNVCVSYKSIPALSFSTTRGGDWIDRNVAHVLGISSSRACGLKEKGIDLANPQGREEEAVEIYYRNLISYTLKNIKERFESSSSMPSFPEPVSIVCAGGTSMIGGFTEVFQQEFEKIQFPLDIKEIRLAEDPLYSVSKGCLVAALSESV